MHGTSAHRCSGWTESRHSCLKRLPINKEVLGGFHLFGKDLDHCWHLLFQNLGVLRDLRDQAAIDGRDLS
jgi:hypothetical protein